MVDGQGNFGSVDGDNAAAMRYTESRMAKMSSEMLKDLDKETVDWTVNFDETLKEPTVLPTTVPTLLINGSEGIAVGMATKIPPHNLTEIINGLVSVIENPNTTTEELAQIIGNESSAVVVTQKNGALGIITRHDIISALSK